MSTATLSVRSSSRASQTRSEADAPVRLDRIEAARRLINYGFYDQDAVLDLAIDKLAEDLRHA